MSLFLGFIYSFFVYVFLLKEYSLPLVNDIGITINTAYALLGLSSCGLLGYILIFKSLEDKISTITKISSGIILYLLTIPFSNISGLSFSFIFDNSQSLLFILILLFLILLPRKKIELLSHISIFIWPLIIFYLLMLRTYGEPLFTDDHGSVIYRLTLLKENFPNIPVYDTEWNAGSDWRDFFATGILNVFLIFSPLIYLTEPLTFYRLIPPGLLLLLLPVCIYISTLVIGESKKSALFASSLAICSCTIWYRWGLSYGSLGFVCSSCLFSLTVSLLLKCIKEKELSSWKLIILTVIISSLSIQWSALILALIPLILVYLYQIKVLVKTKKLLILCISLFLINLPWIVGFVHVSNVLSFVDKTESTTKRMDVTKTTEKISLDNDQHTIKKVVSRIREFSVKTNPILLLLFIPSLFYLKLKNNYYSNYFILISSWLFILGVVGPSIKPQLELERMLVILFIFISIPVGVLINSIFQRTTEDSIKSKLVLTTITSWIILGFIIVSSIFQNKAWDKFVTWTNNAYILKDKVDQNYSGGRLIFSGFILHDFDSGHVAYLTKYLGIPMVGSSPVHNLWMYKDIMPGHYLESGVLGVETFLDLYNASLILSHEKNWKEFFRANRSYYNEVGKVGKFVLFKRNNFIDNYFINGSGEITSQTSSGLTLRLKTDVAVIKFKYFKFLEVKGCEIIEPYTAFNDTNNKENSINLISLRNCSVDTEIKIKSKSLVRRVLNL